MRQLHNPSTVRAKSQTYTTSYWCVVRVERNSTRLGRGTFRRLRWRRTHQSWRSNYGLVTHHLCTLSCKLRVPIRIQCFPKWAEFSSPNLTFFVFTVFFTLRYRKNRKKAIRSDKKTEPKVKAKFKNIVMNINIFDKSEPWCSNILPA